MKVPINHGPLIDSIDTVVENAQAAIEIPVRNVICVEKDGRDTGAFDEYVA